MQDGTSGYGAVSHDYAISKFEITNRQYAEFLNAVASRGDPNGLYSEEMGWSHVGGIARHCQDPSGASLVTCSYTLRVGFENKPVTHVSFLDAARCANWFHNGQPTGLQAAMTTEDGAYAITADGIAKNSIARDPAARFAVPTEDEWYKAAYYDSSIGTYYDYPAGSDTPTTCARPGLTSNTANCGGWARATSDSS